MKIKSKLIGIIAFAGVLFANQTTMIESKYMPLAAFKTDDSAKNYVKKVSEKLSKHKYFDFVDISTDGKNKYVYIKTKDINKKEAIVFLNDVKNILKLPSAYYCAKKGCGFPIKKGVVKNENVTEILDLDKIVAKLSKEDEAKE